MAKYMVLYTEFNSFRDDDAFTSEEQSDGWFENEYRKEFEADTLEEAKKKAQALCDSSSGVFNCYHADDDGNYDLAFTEENVEND